MVYFFEFSLKDTPREKARFRKVRMWACGWLVHQINSLCKVLKLKQNFRNK